MATFGDLSDFVTRVGELLPGDQATLVEPAGGWLNEGYADAVGRLRENVVPLVPAVLTQGVTDVVLATLFARADILDVVSLWTAQSATGSTGRQQLERVSAEAMDGYLAGSWAPGTPQAYTSVGIGRVRLFPPASTATTFMGGDFVQRPAPVTDRTATFPALKPEHHKAIAYYALEQSALDDNRFDDAQQWHAKYEAELNEAAQDANLQGGRRPSSMVPSRSLRGSQVAGLRSPGGRPLGG